ncbi:MAG: ExeA family protein [Terriglobales bacterium]|jgi:type II secretory pathway predicted ATPase ExeA
MYKAFFGLRANPFNVNPDPRYLFLTRHTEEALACLTYGIQSRKGFVLLTGEVGTGKTTLINKLLEWLRVQQVPTAFVFNSRLNVSQFLDYMMADFGIPSDSRSKSQILLRLYNWLLDRYRAGETAVLIVDEAQGLSEELLEEIRMMTNLETFTEKLLQIVLVGQPELEQKLKQPNLRQLRQRLTLRAKTYPLTAEETKSYVAQRLRIAGWNGQAIFEPESLAAIHRYSCGIPRVVNLICEHCLVSAFVDQQRTVTASVVEVVARDFDLIDNPVSGMALSAEPVSLSENSSHEAATPPIAMTPSIPAGKSTVLDADSPKASVSYPRRDFAPSARVTSKPVIDRPASTLAADGFTASPTSATPVVALQNSSPEPAPAPPSPSEASPAAPSTERFDLVDALKTLANLADRLREPEQKGPKERKI